MPCGLQDQEVIGRLSASGQAQGSRRLNVDLNEAIGLSLAKSVWNTPMVRQRSRIISLVLSTALVFALPPSSHGNTSTFSVGDKGPSGGPIVFVDKYDEYSWDYIEAAPANWMGSQSNSTMIRWSPYSSSSAGLINLSSAFGDGAKNTAAILNAFGNGWNIRSVSRDLNDCPIKDPNSRLCNVILTFAQNHGVTRFLPTSWPVLPVSCDGKYLDSIVNSLTGEIKVLSPTSISFVETGSGKLLVDQMLNRSDCKITYAADLANNLKIAGNSGWVLPTLDELALVQKVVGTDLKPPYTIDRNTLKLNGYTGDYYSTSTLRDASTQRVWGFNHESIAGKSGAISLMYGAPIIPIRFFKTSVPLVSLEQSAPAGPTEINGSIIQEDTRWFAKSSPIKVRGTVQIPAGVTLTIAAGSVVDLTEGNFTLIGNLVIGSNASKLSTVVTMGSGDFIAKGSGGTVTIQNADIKANRGSFSSMWNAFIAKLTIDNSYLEGFRNISNGQLTTLSISNSMLRKLDAITGTGSVYNFTLLDNIFEDLRSFSYPSAGIFVNTGQSPPSASVQGNLFFNNANSLEFTLPEGSNNAESSMFRNNRFETPSKLTISGGTEAGRNYWGAIGDASIRAAARVIDGRSDITLRTISFSSALLTPPAFPAKYQVLQDRIAGEKAVADAKAAAELKAKQEAELKAKQEAELKAKQEAELKAKQEAELKAKQEAELKAKQEAEAKAAAELKAKQEADAKAKQEAEAKAAAELKTKQDAEAKAAAVSAAKKTTITCVKGKQIKKVTAVKPKCPVGYKIKK